jgi:hypothetical protein
MRLEFESTEFELSSTDVFPSALNSTHTGNELAKKRIVHRRPFK